MKAQILGETVVITSALSVEDIKTLKAYNPEALVLRDEEGEPTFRVGLGCGGIGKYGVEFDTKNANGMASMSYIVKVSDGEKVEEAVAKIDGPALLKLEQVETQAQAALEALDSQKAEVLGKIQVVE